MAGFMNQIFNRHLNQVPCFPLINYIFMVSNSSAPNRYLLLTDACYALHTAVKRFYHLSYFIFCQPVIDCAENIQRIFIFKLIRQ